MKGIRLTFRDTGCSFDFSSPVHDFGCIMQNALVNIATGQGSDSVYPTKGTVLYKQAVSGVIVDTNSAVHASNFAAVDTLFFSAQQKLATDAETMSAVTIAPVSLKNGRLSTTIQFTSSLGNVFGVVQPIT